MVEIITWKSKSEPTFEELSKFFEDRELSYYEFENVAGYKYQKHSHDYNKFLVMARGKMKWVIDGEEYIVKKGDQIILPKNTNHEVEVLEDCTCMEGHF